MFRALPPPLPTRQLFALPPVNHLLTPNHARPLYPVRATLRLPPDPWDADSGHDNNAFDHGRGPQQHQQQEAAPEGVPGSTPPPRTPLQEQAFQNKYHHQHTQVIYLISVFLLSDLR